jgi:hypothetical protein
MVSADFGEIQVFCEIKSIVFCLFVWTSFSSSLACFIFYLFGCFFSGFFSFCCFDCFGLNCLNALTVVLASYHRKEVLEHHVMVSLWLVVDFGHLSIEVVED